MKQGQREFFWVLLSSRRLHRYFYFWTISGVWCFLQLQKSKSPFPLSCSNFLPGQKRSWKSFFSICQGQLDIHTTVSCVLSRQEQTQTPLTCKFKEKKGESSSMWAQGCLLTGLSQWIITFSSPYLSACFLSNFCWTEQEMSCHVWPLLCLQILMSKREWADFVMHCDVFPQNWAQRVTTML